LFQGRLRHGKTDYPDLKWVRYAMAGERFGAAPGFQRLDAAVSLAANMFRRADA
jgi:hypothetical protein